MKFNYVTPETEVITFSLEMNVMSPGGTGSNMDEPQEWNPY